MYIILFIYHIIRHLKCKNGYNNFSHFLSSGYENIYQILREINPKIFVFILQNGFEKSFLKPFLKPISKRQNQNRFHFGFHFVFTFTFPFLSQIFVPLGNRIFSHLHQTVITDHWKTNHSIS